MKTITLHVPEDTYRAFQKYAEQTGASASELIRRAMESYYSEHLSSAGSIFDSQAADLGRQLRSLSPEDDLLEEMLE